MAGTDINWKLKKRIVEMFGNQSNFASHIGQPEAYVSRVIHGRIYVEKKNRPKWAFILKCDESEIFDDKEKRPWVKAKNRFLN